MLYLRVGAQDTVGPLFVLVPVAGVIVILLTASSALVGSQLEMDTHRVTAKGGPAEECLRTLVTTEPFIFVILKRKMYKWHQKR